MPDESQKPVKGLTSETSLQVSPASLVNRRGPDFRTIYTNNSKFSVSPFDFSFILNEVTENEKGEVYIEQKARILMPPLHAKIFALVLLQNVQNFERQFGEIPMPDNIFTAPVMPTPETHVPAPVEPEKNFEQIKP